MSINLSEKKKKEIVLEVKLNNEEVLNVVVTTSTANNDQLKSSLEKVLEKSEVSDQTIVPIIKNQSYCIGVVCYMEPDKYSGKEISDIHIPFSPELYPVILKELFESLSKVKIRKVVVGHEHGKDKGKCHLQSAVFFSKKVRTVFYPGTISFKYDDQEVFLLYMQQKSRNAYALENYCKKEGNFSFFESDPISVVENDKGKVQAFSTIVKNKGMMTSKEIEDFLFLHEPRTMFINYKNVLNVIQKFSSDEDLPDFSWVLPKHLDNFTVPSYDGKRETRVKFMDIFMNWFNEYCLCEEGKRKKALCLYSKQRALGKTEFAKSLVNDIRYLLMFSNTFTSFDEDNKKLLLLDDMINISKDSIEMWKNLVSGNRTTIRGCYVNQPYNANLPCIITTNNKEMLYFFSSSSMFNTQVIIIEIDEYMGPSNTKPVKLFEKEQHVSKDLFSDIKINEDIQEYIAEKKKERFLKNK